MKKKLLFVTVLCLLAFFAFSCGKNPAQTEPETCKHTRLTDTVFEPDCSLEGFTEHVCLDCGYTYKSNIKAPTGHKLTSVVTAPTCTEQGFTSYTCSVCDYAYTSNITAPTGHTFTSKITPQTCTEEGYTTYTCACGYNYRTSQVVPNGHNFTKTVVPATCTELGHTLYQCSHCSYSYKTDFTSVSHSLTSKVTPPTCSEKGYTTWQCTACKYNYRSAEVAPTGHTFVKTVIPPSFQKTGCTVYTCHCGFSYIGDYVWYSNIFSGIRGNENKVFSRGVDLSYHDGNVNFSSLAASGVDFVILRVGYSDVKDVKFEEYYAAARKAGLDIGCYFYSYATTVEELLTEAKAVIKYLDGKKFEYPIYLDMEDDSLASVKKETLMQMCTVYCEFMTENQYFPGIYTYKNWLITRLDAEKLSVLCDMWVAHYPSNFPAYGENYYSDTYNMWQYTETGNASGVSGNADLNICYKDYPTIIKQYGYNGYND